MATFQPFVLYVIVFWGFGLQSVSLQRCSVPPPRAATCWLVGITWAEDQRPPRFWSVAVLAPLSTHLWPCVYQQLRTPHVLTSASTAIHSSLFNPFCRAMRYTNLLTCSPMASPRALQRLKAAFMVNNSLCCPSCLASSGVGRTVGSRWRTLTASIAFSRFRSTLAQHIRHRHWCHMNTIYISLSMYSRSVGDVDLQFLCGLVFQVHNLPKVLFPLQLKLELDFMLVSGQGLCASLPQGQTEGARESAITI